VNESHRVIDLGGRRLLLTNVEQPLFSEDGCTKLDLIEYYTELSDYVRPGLADRPLAVVRAPDGGTGQSTYHTQALPGLPSWITVRQIRDGSAAGRLPVFLGAELASLVYLVNLGCVSFHPWNVTFSALNHPCELRFDVDAIELPFRTVRHGALLLRDLLATRGLRSWVKTSGGNGLHVMVPLQAKDPLDRVLALGDVIAREAVAREPNLFTLDMRRNRRRDRLLVDVQRNRLGATLISAYCVRERPGAPVSMPLAWSEVERDVYPEDFHIKNAGQRVRTVGDPLAEFFRSPQILGDLREPTRARRSGTTS
jgi:bifunctional non-homologous end joining protein LigD